jgi:hypothetical protein
MSAIPEMRPIARLRRLSWGRFQFPAEPSFYICAQVRQPIRRARQRGSYCRTQFRHLLWFNCYAEIPRKARLG